jgi:hypothetical protein
VVAVARHGSFDFASGPGRQRLVTFNVMVGIDLDLHGSLCAFAGDARQIQCCKMRGNQSAIKDTA